MEDLSVAEAAGVLGTSPQTVRTMLRAGELRGRKQAWGSRLVWAVEEDSVVEFLQEYGRLDGRRRRPSVRRADSAPTSTAEGEATSVRPPDPGQTGIATLLDLGGDDSGSPAAGDGSDRRPLLFRPRIRAAAVVVALGLPVLVAYTAARVLPTALWFAELEQQEMFRSLIAIRLVIHAAVLAAASLAIGVNLVASFIGSSLPRTWGRTAGTVVGALVIGNLFAGRAEDQWQTVALWLHRSPFGVPDPVHGKDVSFFVFSLPLQLEANSLVTGIAAVAALTTVLVRIVTGTLTLRPLGATTATKAHLGMLLGVLALAGAWRLHLQRYLLELAQPLPGGRAFAGANHVDLSVRFPVLTALEVLAVAVGLLLLLSPVVVVRVRPRGRRFLGVVAATVAAAAVLATTVLPGLVQRYVVDPDPLLSEETNLRSSIAATREGLGLDQVDLEEYSLDPTLDAADYAATRQRLERVPTWDTYILGARMRELVSDPPYYRPDEPTLDARTVNGKPQLTVVSAREIDTTSDGIHTGNWENDRLAYTHGLGLIRFSASEVGEGRQPQVLDAGGRVRQPRLYFGNLRPADEAPPELEEGAHPDPNLGLSLLTPVLDEQIADPDWVVANTRRAEVDFPASSGPYHYDGSGGIALSDWTRRLAFALTLGSKELLLSDEITPSSRLLLNRDAHQRLETLAPFIEWDSAASPVQTRGHVVYLVPGVTTSTNYPYAQQVPLGNRDVGYARASVVATVDAFSGEVSLFVTDPADPLILAWQEIFPSLLRPLDELPDALRSQLRYPADLFEAQAAAYERFHDSDPSVFASESDAWSRPLSLSGPIEVAGDIDFDESDEDDLRGGLETSTVFSIPSGESSPRLVRQTFYSPTGGQNLVANLTGWVDEAGRVHLGSTRIPRDLVTFGPAQMSRLTFARPRVRNLLGLRNLEIRDVDASSLDSVLLGRPRILLTPHGVLQLQSLYEGSRGAGAARLLGVTAFLNGRAGLGPDIQSAVRQALNQPPRVRLLKPPRPVLVGRPVEIGFRVENARSEVVTIIPADGGRLVRRLQVTDGRGGVTWFPDTAGPARISVEVRGVDGTSARAVGTVPVLGPAPDLRITSAPRRAVVGEPYRLAFTLRHASSARAQVSTSEGVVLDRRYDLVRGDRELSWTPSIVGDAVITVLARGSDDRTVTRRLRVSVRAAEKVTVPTVAFLRVPTRFVVGRPVRFSVTAADCSAGTARARAPDGTESRWSFPCPAPRAVITWIPDIAGRHTLTAQARSEGLTVQTRIVVVVGSMPQPADAQDGRS